MKLTVLVLWILELGHTVGTAYDVYMHTIPPSQSSILPGIYIAVLMSALITMIVEVALSLRIYRACQRPWNIIGIVVSGLAVVRCGAAIVLVGKLFSDDNFDQSIGSMGGLVTGLLTTSAAIDIIIAVSLLKFLLVKRSTPLASARRILDRLILITLRSGLLTSITAVVVLIVYQINSFSFVWLAIYANLAKLYTISFISSLNGRDEIRQPVLVNRSCNTRTRKRDLSSYRRQSISSIEVVTTTEIVIDEGESQDSNLTIQAEKLGNPRVLQGISF
ncbi:hypothetical protein Ac2012v2_007145 [Leucoagaricus gongylophorus]